MAAAKYFYVLMHDDRDDLEVVDDYEMGNFDLTRLWHGESLVGGIPSEVRMTVSDGAPADYLGNPISWLLFSKRFSKLIEPYVVRHVQFIPITLFSVKTNRPIRRYVVANPLGCVDAIQQREGQGSVNIQDLALHADSIPKDMHLFRLSGQPTTIVFSQELFDVIAGKGIAGIAAMRILAT
jgi:hypothetical protein